ncbi:putative ATPase [Rhizobium sp. PP-F2F-G48]|uniref:AAA family ATPase n=1 Tax=Rhizobium sp. PP-F2F-G48 TaxID=2135651 RepID=UPI0010DD7B47|nr:AAA family ATPase [Rhizobium sp. PP-F2F-G48]TCM48311.1 putative ATPase [Rhizobium sp. PP-F2F-G48]
MDNAEHMFVVTGGPGSGKSSLIKAMAKRGFRIMPEAGRAIIQNQVRIDGPALPWADRAIFAELMLGWEMRSYHEAVASDVPVLMDRGIPDVVGYLTLCNLPVPAHIEAAAEIYPYNKQVFLAPYWDAIFTQDTERKQDRQEAEATGIVMAETYTRLGYQIVELPLVGIEQRADFMADRLRAMSRNS